MFWKKFSRLLDRDFFVLAMTKRFRRTIDLGQLQKMESVLNRHGFTLSQFKTILEFGCRYGRLTQYLFELVSSAQIFGCDINLEELKKCRKKLPKGHFFHNNVYPPLSFEDHQFDFIYSYSVFTHLDEKSHRNWLKELSRILRPGGVMLHTIHSYECLRRLRLFSSKSIEKYELPGGVEQFLNSGCAYHYTIDNEKMPEYGMTIIRSDYVAEKWPQYSGMQILEHAVGAIEMHPEGCQDIILLVKT